MLIPSSADGLHCGSGAHRVSDHRAFRSSRPQRTGSIAASSSGARSAMPSPHPVLSGRAPLRQLADHLEQLVVQDAHPVLSGRAPLRQRRVLQQRHRHLDLIPSSADGLHCGPSGAVRPLAAPPLIPSSADGLHWVSGRSRNVPKLPTVSFPPHQTPNRKRSLLKMMANRQRTTHRQSACRIPRCAPRR